MLFMHSLQNSSYGSKCSDTKGSKNVPLVHVALLSKALNGRLCSAVWSVQWIVLSLSLQSVCKTGRLVVSHEAPLTAGFGAELAATVQVHTNL